MAIPSVYLMQCGVPVTVFERAPGLRQEGSAVALWSNAWRGLDALGVGQQLRHNYKLLQRYAHHHHSTIRLGWLHTLQLTCHIKPNLIPCVTS